MNEFTINSFEEYLHTVRERLGPAERNGKRVRRYFRGQSKRATDGYDLKPSLGRYAHFNRLNLVDRDDLEQEVLETFSNHLVTYVTHLPQNEWEALAIAPAPRPAHPFYGLDDQPVGGPLLRQPKKPKRTMTERRWTAPYMC